MMKKATLGRKLLGRQWWSMIKMLGRTPPLLQED
jgi:hypothetical protein